MEGGRKFLFILTVVVLTLALAFLFKPKSAEGTVAKLRINAQDVKEVFYRIIHKTVYLELQKEINKVSKLEFVNYNRAEALKLMDLLTSQRGIIVEVDPDTGYVYDFGFTLEQH